MNAPLRKIGVAVLVLFAMLFVNLNYRQWYKADDYRTSQYNARVQTEEYERARGKITLANGVAVAESKETTDSLKYLRTYPAGEQYAHVIGYKPVNLGATKVERLQNAFLAGTSDSQFGDRFAAMISGEQPPGGNVLLTLSKAAQETAYKELTGNTLHIGKGAVVALDPKTGKLLAEVSIPSFDPNPLVSHDTKAATAAYNKLNSDEDKPLTNRALSETLAPGSVMKVLVSAAGLQNGLTEDSNLTAGATYQPPQTTAQIKNASANTCPQDQITLKQALTVSCNTAFARYCVESLGMQKYKDITAAFGFESEPRFSDDDKNVMGVVASHTGPMSGSDGKVDPPALAQSCIGQRDVRMTPLQGAMIAATVANDGKRMRPYLVDSLLGADLTVRQKTDPEKLNEPINASVASSVRDMMVSVVENGTGKSAKINGFDVGGKTGTAENGEDTNDHGWFIGFAMKNKQPVIAVAVLLEDAGKGGSHESARIAGQVMKAYIDEQGIR